MVQYARDAVRRRGATCRLVAIHSKADDEEMNDQSDSSSRSDSAARTTRLRGTQQSAPSSNCVYGFVAEWEWRRRWMLRLRQRLRWRLVGSFVVSLLLRCSSLAGDSDTDGLE